MSPRSSASISSARDLESEDSSRDADPMRRRNEVAGVLLAMGSVFLMLSLFSYNGVDIRSNIIPGGNFVGIAGDWTAYVLFEVFGLAAFFIFVLTMFASSCCFVPKLGRVSVFTVFGMTILTVILSVVFHAALRPNVVLGGHPPGGIIGQLLGEILLSLFSVVGTYLLVLGCAMVVILAVTDISLKTTCTFSFRFLRFLAAYATRIVKAWRSERDEVARDRASSREAMSDELPFSKLIADEVPDPPFDGGMTSSFSATCKSSEPRIVKKSSKKNGKPKREETLDIHLAPLKGDFHLPPLALLSAPPEVSTGIDTEDETQLKSTADRLVKILSDFNVFGDVKEIHPGPVVTMFEFQPRPGTKLSRIESLSSEIAMVLEVTRVRIVAPIPGKNAVGFELPNASRETVYLREMLSDDAFANPKHKLPLSLGKDIGGSPYFVDLSKMPHLLIAGTTGSGKSVSLNAMLISLLYKFTPEDLRMLLVDPKCIELGVYEGIPHLLLPVVTDPSKACLALKWAVDEMERRYQLFHDIGGTRNLVAYNDKIDKLKKEQSLAVYEKEHGDSSTVVVSAAADEPQPLEKLPMIVIVVDEVADLMAVAAKDVETSIARLAQKARAAGIHLILATQRPSVDVITGLIKANFPSRISFRVASSHDSKTILNAHGAESLLGQGDMLIIPPGTSDLIRVHGAFVSDDEVNQIVAYLKTQGTPDYNADILKPRLEDGDDVIAEEEKDHVYDQAVAVVAEEQFCSISRLQRRLRIGYNRAARLVEIMEHDGIVGPANHQNKREVLIAPH